VEALSDADARQLLYKSEMGKRREAMRAESAKLGQAELAEPEVAPQVEMAAEAQTPQVCSVYHTCPIVFSRGTLLENGDGVGFSSSAPSALLTCFMNLPQELNTQANVSSDISCSICRQARRRKLRRADQQAVRQTTTPPLLI
jgi:hypothetical protein